MFSEETQNLPLVTFVIPSYNAEAHIERCLTAIERQKYPREKIEVLLIDGDSSDRTLEIARSFQVRVINNPHRIAEFAKSIGIRHSKGKYLVILDCDNEISSDEWLVKNVLPLENDNSLIGMDSVFLVKKGDFLVNRYCALLGLEDPFIRYLADLSRNSDQEDHEAYLVYKIKPGRFPIFGSNGFIWRRSIFFEVNNFSPRYDEADFCVNVVERGYNRIGFVSEVGVYHHHLENVWDFIGKRIRRGNEFMLRNSIPGGAKVGKPGVWIDKYSKVELLKSLFFCLTFFYPAYEAVKGYVRYRDVAWFMHPFLSFLTIVAYVFIFIQFKISNYGSCLLRFLTLRLK